LTRKFCALHKFRKERRSARGCFECGDITHFIADCPKRKKLNSSNKYDYTKQNDYNKGNDKKKYRFEDKKKKKKFQKMMPRACAALSDLDFSSDDSSSSEKDGPGFLCRDSHPTRSNGNVQKIVKTSSSSMVKCWIPKIYLANPSIEPSTFSHSM
jgi:hypothetical protein